MTWIIIKMDKMYEAAIFKHWVIGSAIIQRLRKGKAHEKNLMITLVFSWRQLSSLGTVSCSSERIWRFYWTEEVEIMVYGSWSSCNHRGKLCRWWAEACLVVQGKSFMKNWAAHVQGETLSDLPENSLHRVQSSTLEV